MWLKTKSINVLTNEQRTKKPAHIILWENRRLWIDNASFFFFSLFLSTPITVERYLTQVCGLIEPQGRLTLIWSYSQRQKRLTCQELTTFQSVETERCQ